MTKQVLPASVSMLFSAFFPSWLGCPASLTNRVLIVQASGGPFGLVLTRHIWAFKANWSQAKVRVQSVLHNNSDNTTIHYLWSFIKNSNKKVMWDCETSEIIIKHKHPAVHPESIGPSLCKTSSARSCKQKNCCGVARWAANWMLRTLAQNLQLWWLVHRFFVSLPHYLHNLLPTSSHRVFMRLKFYCLPTPLYYLHVPMFSSSAALSAVTVSSNIVLKYLNT